MDCSILGIFMPECQNGADAGCWACGAWQDALGILQKETPNYKMLASHPECDF